MRLSILIPTIITRAKHLTNMLAILKPQLTTDVEILTECDNGEKTIGAKRTTLLERAMGDYTVFVDDDDFVPSYYVAMLLEAANHDPDCIGFYHELWRNGEYAHTSKLTSRPKNELEVMSHLMPIKAYITKAQPFLDLNHGEDTLWVQECLKRIRSEVFVPEVLYRYMFVSHNKRQEYTNRHVQQDLLRALGHIK